MKTEVSINNEDRITRVNANLERLPLAFLGENSEKIRIQKEYVGTGKRIVLFQDGDGKEKGGSKLSMSPSSTYGLLTGFDIDIENRIVCNFVGDRDLAPFQFAFENFYRNEFAIRNHADTL